MLDILLKQMELQDVEQHIGIHTDVCKNVCRLLKCMVTAARVGVGSHVCPIKVGAFSSILTYEYDCFGNNFHPESISTVQTGVRMRLLRGICYVASIVHQISAVYGT